MTTKNFFVGFVFSLVWAISACTYDTIPLPSSCVEPPVVIISEINDTECGLQTGAIQVAGSGGEEPYIFKINGGSENVDGVFTSLPAGTFLISIEDANGCTSEAEAQVQNSNGINITLNSANSDCETSNGSISVQGQGGTEPYQFKLNGQDFQNSGEFNQLSPGEYAVVATDANGCETSQTVRIFSDVVFADIKAIVTANCAVSNCHDGTISPDFRSDQTIQDRADRIRSRTGARSMPPASSGRSLSTSQIESIACWVEDGAPL
ncbi:MAG: hypothetical protein AAF149_08020 [Bacteroidota bacterium]